MNRSMLGIVVGLVAVLALGGLIMTNNRKEAAPAPSGSSANQQESNQTQSEPSPATNTQANAVTIRNMAFSPATIRIKKGTTITWTNQDSVEHTVTPDDEGSFTGSGMLARGQTFSVAFNTVGTFGYHCAPHPDMQGTIEVTE